MRTKRNFKNKKRGEKNRQRIAALFISVEGKNKTERNYLKAIKQKYKSDIIVKFTNTSNSDPIKLLKDLEHLKVACDFDKRIDYSFCVLDRDYSIERLEQIKSFFSKTDFKTQIIISNPSIEVWFLNHFGFSTKYLGDGQCIKELRKHIPNYEKSEEYSDILACHLDEAFKNTSKQKKEFDCPEYEQSKIPCNPGTDFDLLVKHIIES